MTSGVIFGFDYGTHHIGLAVGQGVTQTASPLTILPAKQGIPNWDTLSKLVLEWSPDRFIVGLPINMDETDSPMSARAIKFARRLSGRFDLPYEMIDERLSSVEARALSSKARVDDLSAVLILETWFQNQIPVSP
ncbi:MAG: Holliday junction resolvase RuvX [Pseudomonadales bacterium]|jgi:putative Holliday junction resolvase|nr:Holliday junction resolvase RuvX [Pseudomonadales bacterium]MDA0760355.1 Holliday junction resolvase RuvX [Pseudomonadota bacterium]MDA0956256.1 Holliday junction resolvase RuvX [Pseudomonadota bacterium]MDA1207508.1 Holliday junction resolvase RuvX [Pseudomonadota bacterium]